jgi:hypothetical protein
MPGTLGQFPSAHEFSDVVQIPGTDQVLLVDDEAKNQVFLWRVGRYGEPDGEVTAIDLPAGVEFEDGEGVTTDGRAIYAITAHSLRQDGTSRETALLQLRWAENHLELDAALTDLRARLESNFPVFAQVKGLVPDLGGLDIEGLAWDSGNKRLLLGIRGPLIDGNPVVVPFRLTRSGQQVDVSWDGPPIPIKGIDGYGIRSIQYDHELKAFLILTGGSGKQVKGSAGKNRFALWRWSGVPEEPAVRLLEFPKMLQGVRSKPEGVCRVTLLGGASYLLIVYDGMGYYSKIPDRLLPLNPDPQ